MFPLHDTSGSRKALVASCTFSLALTSPAAQPQDGASQPFVPYTQQVLADVPAAAAPAHVAFVDGAAAVERGGRSQSAVSNALFVPGDRLRTTRGRAEVLFPDSSVLDLDEDTAVDLQAANLIRLVGGTPGRSRRDHFSARRRLQCHVPETRRAPPARWPCLEGRGQVVRARISRPRRWNAQPVGHSNSHSRTVPECPRTR